MAAASSGRHRQEAMAARADDLEAEARKLAQKAAALRGAAESVRKGNEGEILVGERLDGLSGAGWRVLHDRRKSMTSPANLDHLVVGPPGVFVIDTKNWTGGLLRLDERGMKLGSWRKDDALHAARVDAELVQSVAAVLPSAALFSRLAACATRNALTSATPGRRAGTGAATPRATRKKVMRVACKSGLPVVGCRASSHQEGAGPVCRTGAALALPFVTDVLRRA